MQKGDSFSFTLKLETFFYRESELPMMNITNMTLKNKITTQKNFQNNLKRHSLLKINLFFKKSKSTPLKLPKNIDGAYVWLIDIRK